MRSQLTRSVFRQLLSNEGLILRCPSQLALSARHGYRRGSRPVAQHLWRRTLFGFSRKPPRPQKEASLAPGMEKMLELSAKIEMEIRPPPPEELVKAWRQYFKYKSSKKEAVHQTHAIHVLRVFKHLQKAKSGGESLTQQDLLEARNVLQELPKHSKDAHAELAQLLFTELIRGDPAKRRDYAARLVSVFCNAGRAEEARSLVLDLESNHETTPDAGHLQRLWNYVLCGFAAEDNDSALRKTVDMMISRKVLVDSQRLVRTFAVRDNVEAAKEWWNVTILPQDTVEPEKRIGILDSVTKRADTLKSILSLCIRTGQLDWCKAVFRDALEDKPDKRTWDVVLQWAAGTLGKGVEDVERMIEVMIRRYPADESIRPDTNTINGLVRLAMGQNDPYLAERFLSLGHKYGISPNAQTFVMQMSYRADANDLTGAQAAYNSLLSEEVLDNAEMPAVNKYIRALCAAKNPNFDQIVSITTDLEERKKPLEAETVASLSLMYLNRDAINEVINLLQTYAWDYTLEERELIRKTFMDFCLDPETSIATAWDAYNILRQIFDETTTEQRTQLMNNFFSRGRCDMACHTFGHMRQHPIHSSRPALDTYIQCFEGIANCEDRESLDMVHNMFKMDSSVEPNTRLYNSLILAYTGCDDADRALGFWDDITNSREGPTYNSLEITFRACGRKPFGDVTAREIWGKMRRMNIEVTKEVFAAYVGALAGQGKFEEARDMVDNMQADLGLKLDVFTLGWFYNSMSGQNRKDLVEAWAKQSYEDVWNELAKKGQWQHEEGHMMFYDIKRVVRA